MLAVPLYYLCWRSLSDTYVGGPSLTPMLAVVSDAYAGGPSLMPMLAVPL